MEEVEDKLEAEMLHQQTIRKKFYRMSSRKRMWMSKEPVLDPICEEIEVCVEYKDSLEDEMYSSEASDRKREEIGRLHLETRDSFDPRDKVPLPTEFLKSQQPDRPSKGEVLNNVRIPEIEEADITQVKMMAERWNRIIGQKLDLTQEGSYLQKELEEGSDLT